MEENPIIKIVLEEGTQFELSGVQYTLTQDTIVTALANDLAGPVDEEDGGRESNEPVETKEEIQAEDKSEQPKEEAEKQEVEFDDIEPKSEEQKEETPQ